MGFLFRAVSILLKFAWRISFVMVFLLFVLSQTVAGVADAVSKVFKGAFGVETVADAADRRATAHKVEADTAKREKLELSDRNKKLTKSVDDLHVQNKRLQRDAVDLRKRAVPDVKWKGKKIPLNEAVKEMSSGITKRTQKSAAANLSSTLGESIPYIGVAVIVAATTYELKTACDNMQDMREIMIQLDPTFDAEGDAKHVCGMKVLTKQEIVEKIKNSPEAAWKAARGAFEGAVDAIPSYEQIQAAPGVAWDAVKGAGSATGGWIAETGSATGGWIAEKGSDAAGQASDTFSSWLEYFNEDEPQPEPRVRTH